MRHFNILVVLLTVFAGAVQAQNILEYRCSNSVYQSRLTISNTGYVTINESCFDACPDHTFSKNYVIEEKELAGLKNIMSSTQDGELKQRKVESRFLSCTGGELSVFIGAVQVIIKKIQAPLYSNTATLTTNSSPASLELIAWVTKYVRQKI